MDVQSKDMEKISLFKGPITNTKPEKTISLSDVAALIREDQAIRVQILKLRETKDNIIKEKLDYVTFSGTFTERKNAKIIQHSNLICVDIDNNKIENLNTYNPALSFISPSGNGQKIVFIIDTSQGTHLQYYNALKNYFKREYNVVIDNCKDVSRACFLSHDPEAFPVDDPAMLDREFIKKYTNKFDEITDAHHEGLRLAEVAKGAAPIEPGTRNKTLFDQAVTLVQEGKTKEDIINKFSVHIQPDFSLGEITKIVNNAFRYKPANMPYIRVGTNYFKLISKPDRYNVPRTELKAWTKDTILQDHGRKYLQYIPRYDDFVMAPSNTGYQPIKNNCFNLYSKFSHKPAPGKWIWTERLLRHVFGQQYDLGLRYMQILYLHPDKSTIILVLVSKKRATGKTTFLNWINMLFGANVALLSSSDFTSGFNVSYATKNIICIEETLLEKKLTIEKLKALVTAKMIQVNEKFISQYKIPFFGKVILTSNNETRFALVDKEEIRFFVHKLSTPQFINHNIEANLLEEIPAFLHHLTTLPPVVWTVSRSGFTPDELVNENLRNVVEESRSTLYKELEFFISDFFYNNEYLDKFYATPKDLKQKFFLYNSRIGIAYIRTVLKNEFYMLPVQKTKKYHPLREDTGLVTGRPYLFLRTDFVTDEEVDSEDDDDIAF